MLERLRVGMVAVGLLWAPLAACGHGAQSSNATVDARTAVTEKRPAVVDERFPLTKLRAQLETRIFHESERYTPPVPPREFFELVRYPAPLGSNAAYVSPPTEGPPRPAIIWINGGFDWATGGWGPPGPRDNDQTAMLLSRPDLVLMRPSLRGAADNPGRSECFLGEVDDVLAALAYLQERPDVDNERIYLGGHSTGGTMALLVAASTDGFRAVFAFGPVDDPRNYGEVSCVPPTTTGLEARLRSPIEFVADIRTPTFIVEGAAGNPRAAHALVARRGEAPVEFLEIPGSDHFNVIAPGTETAIAVMLTDDSGAMTVENILGRR